MRLLRAIRTGTAIIRRCGTTLALLIAGPLTAAEVPESAYSTSLAIRAALLEPINLVYVFPHRLGYYESQVFALDTSRPSLGLSGHSGRMGFMVLAENVVGGSEYQAGLALRAGQLHFGLAARGFHRAEDEASFFADLQDVPPRYDYTVSQQDEVRLEGAGSIGVDTGPVQLDLAFEIAHENFTHESVRQFRLSNGVPDSVLINLESEDELRSGVTGRLRFTPGDQTELVGFGTWRERQPTIVGTVLGDGTVRSVDFVPEFTEWAAGLLLSFRTEHVDWMGVSAYWHSNVQQFDSDATSSGAAVRQTSARHGWLSAGLHQTVWREWVLRAGVFALFEEVSSLRVSDGSGRTDADASQTKRFTQGFAWGTSFHWRRIGLDATLQRRLDLLGLLALLDVRISI